MASSIGQGRRAARLGLLVMVFIVQWALHNPTIDAAPAETPGPSGTTVAGRCTQYEPALAANAPPAGWDVGLMSAIMWRESKCTPTSRSRTFDTGLMQINDINHAHLRVALDETVNQSTLTDPVQNIRAAAALCTYWSARGRGCYWPWTVVATPRTPGVTAPATPPATPTPPAAAPTGSTSTAPGRCTQYEPAIQANAPAAGWNVEKMSRLMYATSRCRPGSRWTTSTGLLRISDVNAGFLAKALATAVNSTTLTDPVLNIRAAAALCTQWRTMGKSCYAPWGGSG
jgi:hypothetical protein